MWLRFKGHQLLLRNCQDAGRHPSILLNVWLKLECQFDYIEHHPLKKCVNLLHELVSGLLITSCQKSFVLHATNKIGTGNCHT